MLGRVGLFNSEFLGRSQVLGLTEEGYRTFKSLIIMRLLTCFGVCSFGFHVLAQPILFRYFFFVLSVLKLNLK